MKYGVILPPAPQDESSISSNLEIVFNKIKQWRNFLLIVILPTLIFAAYEYLIAANQYETTSEFLVKSGDGSQISASGLGQVFGIGGQPQGQSEILSVPVYLESHEVLTSLQKRINLKEVFRRPEADIFSRLLAENPEPEKLLKYYRSKVNIRHNSDTGIMQMTVRTFRPDDSLQIARALLQLGEHKINEMNQRSYEGAVESARLQLARAEQNAADIQRQITVFRQMNQDVDPELSGQAQIKLVAELNTRLASLRAQLIAMGGVISHNSPQYLALQRQVDSLANETAAQTRKMGGKNTAIASTLGKYEELKVRQEFAAKNYEAAAASLQRAMEQAQKQRLYFVRVVDPNLPVRSLYPNRAQSVITLFFFLLISYSIGWLIVAGVREHEA